MKSYAAASYVLGIVIVILSTIIPQTRAQFGVVRDKGAIKDLLLKHQAEVAAATSAEISANGEANVDQAFLSPQDAADMEEVILKAGQDEQTLELIARMKAEMGQEVKELGREPSEEILRGMKLALDEMKMLEYLFARDPKQAVVEMEKDGMIGDDKKKLKEYKKNPDLLRDETNKGLYFSFISLAVAGGYL
mmetsp:Transcript_11805/g.24331  ORF Transcript_11805/g.24331 Transcript_11805/m.24331 type:complete len:192 (+) Transcript_11805:1313-1888(+)